MAPSQFETPSRLKFPPLGPLESMLRILRRRFSSAVHALAERGLISQMTDNFPKEPSTFYIGFDPTAPSLHIGNLLGIITSWRLQLAGWNSIFLVGGATARIGDPSFRESAKSRLDDRVLEENTARIKMQLDKLSENAENALKSIAPNSALKLPTIVDNYDWLKEERLIDFLDRIGTQMRMGPMLSRESVQRRLNSDTHPGSSDERGMSFTEFTYQLLQGYDFLHLYRNYGCQVQIGGSDQWGNMLAGVELIGKVMGKSASVLTYPLLTASNGEKMGKSAGNAVWLDASMTSPYEFYQYLMRLSDEDAFKFMPYLTFLSKEDIMAAKSQHDLNPEQRHLQKTLAHQLTSLVHSGITFLLCFSTNMSQRLMRRMQQLLRISCLADIKKCSLIRRWVRYWPACSVVVEERFL